MSIDVKEIHLHNIDKDNSNVLEKQVDINDARNYITDLTNALLNNKKMRYFVKKSDSNPVITQIVNIINQCLSKESVDESAATTELNLKQNYAKDISDRLLTAQLDSIKKHPNFKHINKCSLIQSLVEKDSEFIYIFALVDHNGFIDTSDLTKHIGLPDSEKATYKSARIHFNNDLTVKNIYLYDSNKKISDYWYDGFLDLKPLKDDANNTATAFQFINNTLSHKLSKKSPTDYNEYTNNLKMYFKHYNNFDINECLDFVFNTDPYDSTIDISSIKESIINTNNNKNKFDVSFSIDTKDIDKSLRNIKYKLNKNMELKISNLDNIKDSVITKKLPDGDLVLMLKNVDKKELRKFNFDNIDL